MLCTMLYRTKEKRWAGSMVRKQVEKGYKHRVPGASLMSGDNGNEVEERCCG